jgi:hypothetical protein
VKTIEDIRDELAIQESEAEVWLERRADADRERMIAHLKFIRAARRVDELRTELMVAEGESS